MASFSFQGVGAWILLLCAAAAARGDVATWTANGHGYELVAAPGVTWRAARVAAETRGGYLATITSAEEDAFVFSLLAAATSFWSAGSQGPWLGGYQPAGAAEPAGGWCWATGEPWTYANWNGASGEPNQCNGNPEDYLQYYSYDVPRWNDAPDGSIVPGYVVEYDRADDAPPAAVDLHIAPDAHCHLADLLVNGQSIGVSNAYIIAHVRSDVTIVAVCRVDQHTLRVESSVGSPDPAVGSHAYDYRTVVTCAVPATNDDDDGFHYVCTGWTGTGSVPATGASRCVSFRLERDSSICWRWTTVPDTHYVSLRGGNAYPFTTWAGAATTLQAAVDAARAGDTVLVTNGVYDAGVTVWSEWGNRVGVSGPITLRSVNGPKQTAIRGDKNGATRCAFLQLGAVLDGFTLCDGGGELDPLGWIAHVRGGGVFATPDCTVRNCIIVSNSAGMGGGAYGGTLINCLVRDNSAFLGGGTCDGAAQNCTIVGNDAWNFGGGVLGGTLWNSIVYFNRAWSDADHIYASMQFCCTWPPPAGNGNIADEPLFADAAAGDFRLLSNSPCVNAGTNQDWMTVSADLGGHARISGGRVDLGAYEFEAGLPGPDLVRGLVAFYPFNGNANDESGTGHDGEAIHVTAARDRFGRTARAFQFNGSSSAVRVSGTLLNLGQDEYTICEWFNPASTNAFQQELFNTIPHTGIGISYHYSLYNNISLWLGTGTPGSWTYAQGQGAKRDYRTNTWYFLVLKKQGGRYDLYINNQLDQSVELTNRFDCAAGARFGSIEIPQTLEFFRGALDDLRVYDRALSPEEMTELYDVDESLMGRWTFDDGDARDASGSGHDGIVTGATVTNGVAGRAFHFDGRSHIDVGDLRFTSDEYTVNGWIRTSEPGTYDLYRMWIGKMDPSAGDATFELFLGDGATAHPGGINGPCYIVWASGNSIVNLQDSTRNLRDGRWHMMTATYRNGRQRIFVDGVLAAEGALFGGAFPIVSGAVMIGGICGFGPYHHPWNGDIDEVSIYRRELSSEEISALYNAVRSRLPIEWLARYGFALDGSDDLGDGDGDGMSNWQEWQCGTDPTSGGSLLECVESRSEAVPEGIVVRWHSVTGRQYTLERSTNLMEPPPFAVVASNLVGQADCTTYTDRTAVGQGSLVYRVEVQ